MENLKEEKLKAHARKISTFEGAMYSVSDGFGFRSITPYALALGAGNIAISLLSSIPSLLGNFSQLFTYKLMRRYPRKKIVATSVLLQAIMWLLLLIPGLLYFKFSLFATSVWFLIGTYTVLIICGALAGPVWSSWMRDISPKSRASFFANRNRIAGFVSLIFMLIAGFILDFFKQTNIFFAFIILFSVSFVFRGLSSLLFLKQYEPQYKQKEGVHFTFFQFVRKMPFNNFGKFVIFISLTTLTVAIASPFFAVYMLKDLGFSYSLYMYALVIPIIVSLFFMKFWGRFLDRYGNLEVLKINGFFVGFIPLLWLLTLLTYENVLLSFVLVLIIESFSGFIWAGFNLAAGNFIYDAVTKQRMAICVAYQNIIGGICVFIGATAGGLISKIPLTFLPFSLLGVFLISGILRFLVYLFIFPKVREVRAVEKFEFKEMIGGEFGRAKTSLFETMRLRSLRPKGVE